MAGYDRLSIQLGGDFTWLFVSVECLILILLSIIYFLARLFESNSVGLSKEASRKSFAKAALALTILFLETEIRPPDFILSKPAHCRGGMTQI